MSMGVTARRQAGGDERFRPAQRLRRPSQFDAVFEARCRKHVGPLIVRARPNGLGWHRLGLIVPRRVGKAVRRNRIKRLLRESFRLRQRDWPGSYDLIVSARPHEPLPLERYQALLDQAVAAVDRQWRKRASR